MIGLELVMSRSRAQTYAGAQGCDSRHATATMRGMKRLVVLGLLAAVAAGSAAGSTTPYTQAELRALNSPKLNAAIVESMRGSKPGDTLDDVIP